MENVIIKSACSAMMCDTMFCRFELVTVAVVMTGALECTSISVSNSLFHSSPDKHHRCGFSSTDESSLPSTFTTLSLAPTSAGFLPSISSDLPPPTSTSLPTSTFIDLLSSTFTGLPFPTSTYLLPSTPHLSPSPLPSTDTNRIQPAILSILITCAILLVTAAITICITGVICIYCRRWNKKNLPSQLKDSCPSTPGARAFTVTSPEPYKEQQKCRALCSEMKVTKQLRVGEKWKWPALIEQTNL